MEHERGINGKEGTGGRSSNRSPRRGTQEENFFKGVPLKSSRKPCPLDGCIRGRLGCPSGFPSYTGSVGSGSEKATHKLVRAQSCSPGSHQNSPASEGDEYPTENRQLHCSCLYKQRRGDEVSTPLSSSVGDISVGSSVLSRPESSSYPRKKECDCRQLIKGSKRSKTDGVGSGKGCSKRNIPNFQGTQHRSLGYSRKQAASGILLPLANEGSMGLRCPECRLVRDVCICIPPTNNTASGVTKGPSRTLHVNTDRSTSPPAVMVPSVARSYHRLPETASRESKVTNAEKRPLDSSRPEEPETCRMKDFWHRKGTEFLSEKAQKYIAECKRPSTRKMYRARQRNTVAGVVNGMSIRVLPLLKK